MIGLQIDCQLSGPWCPPAFGLHLDGLVAHALVREQIDARSEIDNYEAVLADLPFERDESGVWKASQFFPVGWVGQERRYVTGKTPVRHLAMSIGAGVVDTAGGSVIDTVRGIAKDHAGYITIEHVRGLRAWCVADEDALRHYLGSIEAVGTRTRMGFGTLRADETGATWRITPCDAAMENWKLRSAPARLTDRSYPSIGSWAPPYWRGAESIWRPTPMRLEA